MKKIDMYGQPIQFTYKKSATFPTSCGLVTSIIVIIIVFAYIILYCIDFAKMEFPTVVSVPETYNDPPLYEFSSTADPMDFKHDNQTFLQMFFGFKNRSNGEWITIETLNETGITLLFEEVKNDWGTQTRRTINLIQVKDEDAPEDLKDSFEKYELNKTYKADTEKFQIKSEYLSTNAKYYSLKVIKNTDLAPESESIIDQIDFYFIYSDYLFSEKEKKKNLIPYYDWQIIELSSGVKLFGLSYFQIRKITSYKKILPKYMIHKGKKEYYSYFDHSKFSTIPSEIYPVDNIIIHLYIQSSQSVLNYERTYSNLFEILGIIGGFAQIIFIVGGFFACYPAQRLLEEDIVNEFYNVIDPQYKQEVSQDLDNFLEDGKLVYEREKEKKKARQKPDPKKKKKEEEEDNQEEKQQSKEEKKRAQQLKTLKDYFSSHMSRLKEISEKIKNKEKAGLTYEDKRFYYSQKILFNFSLNMIYSGFYYTHGERCCNCFCCEPCKPKDLQRKNSVYYKALDTLHHDTDFRSILGSLTAFEGIKTSFLQEKTQLAIFKALANKSFYAGKNINKDKNKKNDVIGDLQNEDDLKKLHESMQKFCEHTEKVDLKIDSCIIHSLVDDKHQKDAKKFMKAIKKNLKEETEKREKEEKERKKKKELDKKTNSSQKKGKGGDNADGAGGSKFSKNELEMFIRKFGNN